MAARGFGAGRARLSLLAAFHILFDQPDAPWLPPLPPLQVTQQQAHTAGIVAGAAAAMQGSEAALSADSSLEPLPEGIDGEDDGELEVCIGCLC